jgi:hypothetical protein
MPDNNVGIGFDFTGNGQEKLLQDIVNLEESLKYLSKTMTELPLEELNKRYNSIKSAMSGVYKEAISLTKVNENEGKSIVKLLEDSTRLRDELDKLIAAKQALTKTDLEFNMQLDASRSNLRKAVKDIEDYNLKTYKGKMSLEELNQVLVNTRTRYLELSTQMAINIEMQEEELGYYKELKIATDKLIKQRDILIKTKGEESAQVLSLTKSIQENNLELEINTRLLKGASEAKSILAKSTEKLVAIQNQDIKATGDLIVAKAELKDSVNQYLGITQETILAKKQDLEIEIAELKLQPESISNIARQVELRNQLKNLINQELGITIESNLANKQSNQIETERAKLDQQSIKNEAELVKLRQQRKIAVFDELARQNGTLSYTETQAKKEADAVEKAEKKKLDAIEKTTIAYKIQQFVVRDLLRLVAAMVTIYPIMWLIGEGEKLVKILFGIDEGSLKAKEGMEKFRYELSQIPSKVDAVMEKENMLNEILLKTADNTKLSFDIRSKALDEYAAKYGHLLDMYTSDQINDPMNGEIILKVNKANILMRDEELAKEKYEQVNKRLEEIRKEKAEVASHNDDPGWIDAMGRSNHMSKLIAEEVAIKMGVDPKTKKKVGLPIELKDAYEDAHAKVQEFINSKDNVGLVPVLEGEIKELERVLRTRQYAKYGITDKTTVEEVRKKKKDIDTDPEFLQPIKDLQQKKDLLAELLGKKDPKGASKHKDILTAKIGDENQIHADNLDKNNLDFVNSNQSFNDKLELYRKDEVETKRHYDEILRLIRVYGAASGESKDKLKERSDKAQKELDKENETRIKNQKQEILELHKWNEARLNEIDHFNEEVRKSTEKLQDYLDNQNREGRHSSKQKKQNTRWNPLSALFGAGGGTPNKDFKEDINSMSKDISEFEQIRAKKFNEYIEKNKSFERVSEQVGEDQKVPYGLMSPTQKADYQEHIKQRETALKEKDSALNDFNSSDDIVKKLVVDKEGKLDLKTKEGKIAVAKATFDATEKIANSAFELQKKRIDRQMQNIQALAQFEMTLAGNNSAGKIRIARREHDELLVLKRKQAETEKRQAIFSATLDMGKGIAGAISSGLLPPANFILAATIAAMDLTQIANLTSLGLPQYFKGKKAGEGRTGLALINEQGPEPVKRNGSYYFLNQGLPGLAMVEKQDEIIPNKKFIDGLVKGTGIIQTREDLKKHERAINIQAGLSKVEMQDIMDKAVAKIPQPIINQPVQSLQDKYIRQQLRNGL